MNNAFDAWQISHQGRINKFLKKKLDKKNSKNTINDATNYALLNGGKRFRALLVYAIGEINATNQNVLDFIAASIEIIHAYSLTHDDLPDMDDDSLRRGLPSCHIKYGASQAILAGDGLQSLAFEFLVSPDFIIDDAKKINLISHLSKAIGINGMVFGQSLDMECSNKELDIKLLEKIQKKKTGELIHASCIMSYSISNFFDSSVEDCISRLAYLLGQLYQITDDILDGTSTSKDLGKTSGKDQKDNKATYVSIMGITKSKKIKENFYVEIKNLVKEIPGNTQTLNNLIDKIYARDY
ncbi:polyprenyl synthetase family protein [Methylophilaceae bacterium Uisw_097]